MINGIFNIFNAIDNLDLADNSHYVHMEPYLYTLSTHKY